MTIVKVESYVWLDEDNDEEKDSKEATRIVFAIGDSLFGEGFGNVAEKDPADTSLSVVLVVSEAKPDDWKRSVKRKSTKGIDFPTADAEFAKQMDAGLVEELSL